jgi:hypothetical protein
VDNSSEEELKRHRETVWFFPRQSFSYFLKIILILQGIKAWVDFTRLYTTQSFASKRVRAGEMHWSRVGTQSYSLT